MAERDGTPGRVLSLAIEGRLSRESGANESRDDGGDEDDAEGGGEDAAG